MECTLFTICVPMYLIYIKQETGVLAMFWYTKKKVRFGLKSVSGEFCFFNCLIVSIPIGTNCAPLVAELFLLCYERNFTLSLSDINQSDAVEAFNSR